VGENTGEDEASSASSDTIAYPSKECVMPGTGVNGEIQKGERPFKVKTAPQSEEHKGRGWLGKEKGTGV